MSTSFLRMPAIIMALLFVYSCKKSSTPIQFAVSAAVVNGMDFSPLGVQNGDRIDLLRFYTLDGAPHDLDLQHQAKPTLLVSGSYTCDVTRANMPSIDSLYREFGSHIDIYLVNTLEAHPDDSPSPYSAEPEVWLAKENVKDSLSAAQPKTMEERELLAKKWIKESQIHLPILLDGPENPFWNFAGQAPNMAILVDDGVVVLKQSWFDFDEMRTALSIGM